MAFADAIKALSSLGDAPEHRRREAETEVWEKLQPGIKAVKKDAHAIGEYSITEMQELFDFLLMYQERRKVLASRVKECLKILLDDSSWFRVAQTQSELNTALCEVFSDDAKLKSMLASAECTSEASTASHLPPVPVASALSTQSGEQLSDAKQQICAGLQVMEKFDWRFPSANAVSSDSDIATEGFTSLYRGLKRLTVVIDRLPGTDSSKQFAEDALQEFEQFWPSLLTFVASLMDARRSLVGQGTFVVDKLSLYSDSFKNAVAEHGLDLPTSKPSTASTPGADSSDAVSAAADLPQPSESEPTFYDGEEGHDSEPESDPEFGPEAGPELGPTRRSFFEMDDMPEETQIALASAVSSGELMQWMWNDARVVPLPGFNMLARADPLRWSSLERPDKLSAQLEAQKQERPVRLLVKGWKKSIVLPNPQVAAALIRT